MLAVSEEVVNTRNVIMAIVIITIKSHSSHTCICTHHQITKSLGERQKRSEILFLDIFVFIFFDLVATQMA